MPEPIARNAPSLILRKRISHRAFVGTHAVTAVVAVVVWATAMVWRPAYLWALLAGALVPFIIGMLYAWLVRLSTEYRLFSDSLEVESGILSRRIENIQLFRVRDLGLQQSLPGRLLNVGDIAVTSTDQSAPHYVLRGLDDPRALYDTLRDLVSQSQAARRTMIVEEEPQGS